MRVLLLPALLSGCTFLTDVDRYNCNTNADCGEGRFCSANKYCLLTRDAAPGDGSDGDAEKPRACGPDAPCEGTDVCVADKCESEEVARWGCVGSRPERANPSAEPVVLRLQVTRREGSASVPVTGGVTVIACELPTCEAPVGPFALGDDGWVEVVVQQGFKGFVKLTADGLLDTLYQLQSPLNEDWQAPRPVTMLSEDNVSGLALLAQAEVDLEGRGVLLFQIFDCVGEGADDVSITFVKEDPAIDIFYLAPNEIPQPDATATSAAGVAGAADVPQGLQQLTLTRESTGTQIVSLAVAALPATVTYVPYRFGK